METCGEVWRDMGRCLTVSLSLMEKCAEIWGDMGRYGETSDLVLELARREQRLEVRAVDSHGEGVHRDRRPLLRVQNVRALDVDVRP